jgi:hypothetical protein
LLPMFIVGVEGWLTWLSPTISAGASSILPSPTEMGSALPTWLVLELSLGSAWSQILIQM